MTDFNKTKFYCSRLGLLMSEVNGKSPLEYWTDACDLLAEETTKYEAMPNKSLKSAITKLEKIKTITAKKAELELLKDEDVLSEGCKTYLTSMYGFVKYNKWVAPSGEGNKYSSKGQLVEDESIAMLSRLDGKQYSKNPKKLSNDLLIGQPDIIADDIVIDVKSSWDIEGFLSNLTKPLIKPYWWQVQGYMELTSKTKAEVSFCLVSTPESIVDDEVEKYRLLCKPQTEDEIRSNLNYNDIPEIERRIRFIVERDDDAIRKIQKRVAKCREYLFAIEELHLNAR